ncbi:tetratricopeptide repeat protein [Saccharothrix sp. AJ9571]|nr:tetratricopeptide repeat protein [Saccharothrix sp. AJ9571]
MSAPDPTHDDISSETLLQTGTDASVRVDSVFATAGGNAVGYLAGPAHFHQSGPQPPVPIPRQLPPAPAGFVGRADHLAALDNALITPEASSGENGVSPLVVISAIGGAAGIGKTWLAHTWANHNKHRFPDGQLAADLHGFSSTGEPRQAAEVLGEFLTALGVDHRRQPEDLDARAALFRTHTSGKRMLIMLDNAANANQVVPLLPGGATCTVLVTSRNRLPALITRHGARPLNVDVFTDDEAHALLRQALGDAPITAAMDRAVNELADLCGHFPMALGLVAARFRNQPDLASVIVTELRGLGLEALECDDPGVSLPVVLSWSYKALPRVQRDVYWWIGLADLHHITETAIAVSSLSRPAVRRALRALEQMSLLNRRACGHYVMHDLVRAYARDVARRELGDGAPRGVMLRLVTFYAKFAEIGDDALPPDLAHCKLPSLVVTADAAPVSREMAGATCLADLLGDSASVDAALAAATEERWHEHGWRLFWLRQALSSQYDARRNALSCWMDGLAVTHELLGRVLGNGHADDRNALAHYTCARDLNRALDRPLKQAQALAEMAFRAARVGDCDYARECGHGALGMFHDKTEVAAPHEARALTALGNVEYGERNHQAALNYYQQVLVLYDQVPPNPLHDIIPVYCHVGHCYMALGQNDQARAIWKRALNVACTHYGTHIRENLDRLDHLETKKL